MFRSVFGLYELSEVELNAGEPRNAASYAPVGPLCRLVKHEMQVTEARSKRTIAKKDPEMIVYDDRDSVV